MLELKFAVCLLFPVLRLPFNRTMLELKYLVKTAIAWKEKTFNRTMLELKYMGGHSAKLTKDF